MMFKMEPGRLHQSKSFEDDFEIDVSAEPVDCGE